MKKEGKIITQLIKKEHFKNIEKKEGNKEILGIHIKIQPHEKIYISKIRNAKKIDVKWIIN